MSTSLTDDEYRMLVDLQGRFEANGEDKQAEFCDRILSGLDRPDGR